MVIEKTTKTTQKWPSCQLQGQPLGFDTKYLALADRNMQV
jgi:hypothetical protein